MMILVLTLMIFKENEKVSVCVCGIKGCCIKKEGGVGVGVRGGGRGVEVVSDERKGNLGLSKKI